MTTTTKKQTHPVPFPAEQEIRFWMRAPAITITPATHVSDALGILHEHGIRRLPVVRETGELLGIITQGDIRGAEVLRADGMDPFAIAAALRHITVAQVMTEQPVTLSPEAGLREAALLMIEHKIGGLPVVDADDYVVGIITESDLFEALVQQLDQATGWQGDKVTR
jgi:acetoin utilization protein AcuB/CBS domain-containing protein